MTIQNRYDFVILFDVENGNPNGDPDAGNAPRIDAETGHGFITDVCLKRKIRNYVDLCKAGDPKYQILVKPDKSLNAKYTDAYIAENLETENNENKKDMNAPAVVQARNYMCAHYYDVRTFGAVMSTGDNPCGIVRGPVQINFARSLSPVSIQDITITRQARTTEERAKSGETEMGRKAIIPYGLYRAEGYVSAASAEKTGLSDDDIELLWTAIINMFEEDHSAARGKMCMRKLYVFKHENRLGNCPSHILFDKIKVTPKTDEPPRSFDDYNIEVENINVNGVRLTEMVENKTFSD